MVFRKWKIKKFGKKLAQHMGWLARLEEMRLRQIHQIQQHGFSKFTKGIVLTTNYEMASHAARALSALRALEEVGGLDDSVEARAAQRETREKLTPYVDLPAFPRRDMDSTPDEQVDSLWQEFVEYEHTKSADEQMLLASLGQKDAGRSSEVQVTTEDLGKLLLRAASDLAQDLVPHLMKAGLSPGAELAFHATMFSMFPLEMLVAKQFAEQAPEIGAAMRRELVAVAMEAGINGKTRDQWDEYLVDKFIEHAGRFASIDSPLALTQFGIAAAEDLFGTTDIYVATTLSTHFTTIMTNYPEAIAQYDLVETE